MRVFSCDSDEDRLRALEAAGRIEEHAVPAGVQVGFAFRALAESGDLSE